MLRIRVIEVGDGISDSHNAQRKRERAWEDYKTSILAMNEYDAVTSYVRLEFAKDKLSDIRDDIDRILDLDKRFPMIDQNNRRRLKDMGEMAQSAMWDVIDRQDVYFKRPSWRFKLK